MSFDIVSYWYQRKLHPLLFLLLPVSWLFGLVAAIRRSLFHFNILKIQRFNVPVIVVGNITVGGTGKTPFVIWLAQWLQQHGYHPGIVSRGMGGEQPSTPVWVKNDSAAESVGDEALLLMYRTNCPLVICTDRAAAVSELLSKARCDIVISDDGLQHYRLGRDIEIAMVDGVRGFGNECLLPAGPLREPISHLQLVDVVVTNGGDESPFSMRLQPTEIVAVSNQNKQLNLNELSAKKIHAVAGIGHPERFFQSLRQMGFDVIPHAFPDHYIYQAQDLEFNDDLPILMTEKDAVKCAGFASERFWYVSVEVVVSTELKEVIARLLREKGFFTMLPVKAETQEI